MGLPGRDEARNWVGRTVVDREGVELGACTAVLADEATGVPEWFYVEVEGVSAVVPALDADGAGDQVVVTVTRTQVTGAPSSGGALELSQALEADLYRHYGIDASREASQSLLPAEPASSDTTAATDGDVDTAVAAATAVPVDTDTQAAGRRAPVVAAVGLAAVAAGLGVARARARQPVVPQPLPRRLWAQRPWAPAPPSPADLVAGQVLAVSAQARRSVRNARRVAGPVAAAAAESARHRALLVGEGARHLAVVTGPVAATVAESARHRALQAGETARHLGRTAAPVAVLVGESVRHRAVLGGEQLRHGTRLARQAAIGTATRVRTRV
ncbi:hypothetical protein [Geodermatophilus sp. DSM 45219]|uniref:hypothetical protein n=1 Tax=Geodermatophilus sp. DSM 45219 TaxID=1881103 RepID=UPI000880B7A9|nr:hypothetical protein [Geodermatophilus sp. DSM 45219]SDN46025.1 hypothetical protein SAMN05428965_0487 [Geodermatophilus sp. DSM 45219]